MSEYYRAYDGRYSLTAAAGIELWGHSVSDLEGVITRWVEKNSLQGKRIVEFACGECSSGVILSKLGCRYLGIDVSPVVVERSRERLKDFPEAEVICMDLVKGAPDGKFDAALDISGLHMLVVDEHRRAYLRNMAGCLDSGAPVMLHCEAFREDFPDYVVESLDKWAEIVGIDFETPQRREMNGREVMLRTLPARPLSRNGYKNELITAGIVMENLFPMNQQDGIFLAAEIHGRKV